MGSSTTDVRRPIGEAYQDKIIKLAYELEKFTLEEMVEKSGIPSKIVEQFLVILCYMEVLKFVINEYQIT